jgi:hypothetical protein
MALQSTRDLFVCRSLRANPRSVTLSSPAGQHRIDGRYQIIMDQEIWENICRLQTASSAVDLRLQGSPLQTRLLLRCV